LREGVWPQRLMNAALYRSHTLTPARAGEKRLNRCPSYRKGGLSQGLEECLDCISTVTREVSDAFHRGGTKNRLLANGRKRMRIERLFGRNRRKNQVAQERQSCRVPQLGSGVDVRPSGGIVAGAAIVVAAGDFHGNQVRVPAQVCQRTMVLIVGVIAGSTHRGEEVRQQDSRGAVGRPRSSTLRVRAIDRTRSK